MRRRIAAILVTFGLLVPLQEAAAHGGGLDRYGCHRETATNTRHCHRSSDDDKDVPWAVIAGVAGGALVLFLVLRGFNERNQAALADIQIVPHLDPENRLGVAAQYSLGPAGLVGVRTTAGFVDEPHRVGAYWRLRF